MPADRPILLKNARLIDPAGDREERGGVLVRDGVIQAVGPQVVQAADAQVIDCGGQVLAPASSTCAPSSASRAAAHRETLKSAGEAAAAGGVTTIVSMPDTSPVLDDPAVIDFIVRRARDTSIVNIRPAAALTKGLQGQEMAEIGLLKEAGAIVFTDGARSVTNAQVMRRALTYARDFDALIVHHVEDPDLVGQGVMNEGEFASRLGLPGIPREAETVMLERDMRLVRLTGGRYHAAMISLRRFGGDRARREGKRAAGHLRRVHQPPVAQRERHRRLPHLPQALAAAAPRGRPAGDDRGAGRRAPST